MPKRDGTPTKGEARAARRAERNAANAGLDYAAQRLAAQAAISDFAAKRSGLTPRHNAATGETPTKQASKPQRIPANASDRSVDDDAEVSASADADVGYASCRPSPPSADPSQTPTVSSPKTYLAPQTPFAPPPIGVLPDSSVVHRAVAEAGVGKLKPPMVDDAGDVRWVMENLHEADAEGRAPSRSALAMLMFARGDKNAQLVFVRDIFGKVFINKNAEEQERLERRRLGEIGEMVERCLALRLRTEAELREPVIPAEGGV